MGVVIRSAVLGLAVGGRASAAIRVPVGAGTRGRHGPGPALLRGLAALAVLGETAGDKLPSAPPRTAFPAFTGRLVGGALGAVALSVVERRSPGSHVVAALVGLGAAYAGSYAGTAWRRWAATDGPDALRPDWRAAAIEDALVQTVAGGLVRTSHR
ncbi:hypothetical protein GXP71_17920 [Cellulomonas sp. H30R-01]|uniref:DUF4126 domain-containing protein n=1 Tax=Cellulomonas algicola TaxID=2071633 RepID=A0A401UXF3_9CELL|nr:MULTISPECIES: hypothetical protein [Cellulomonas]QHT57766.1 hypothetical protein GXP71_17920 [Cellulomonas sp. H30R-01]GCD19369.1 hypothetical protein CTKZ_09310 [Cellulomonas algicola]